jgi:hypothetical protein
VKPFKSTMIVQHPQPVVWRTIRDRLSELVPYMEDVAAVTTKSREEAPPGTVRLVNHWTAKAPLPAALAPVIREDMLSWIDYAEWHDASGECSWRIEPRFQVDRIRCSGIARYADAMAGRGTRVTFEGNLEIVPGGGLLAGPVARALEAFIIGIIPRNAQSLYRAAGSFLEREARPRAGTGLRR